MHACLNPALNWREYTCAQPRKASAIGLSQIGIEGGLMRKLLVVIVCMAAIGWVLCQPALSQTDVADDSHPVQADSGWNHHHHAHVVPIAAIRVPGTSKANPFVAFDQASVDTKLQLLFVSSRSTKAVAIFDAFTDRKIGETPAIFAGVGIDSSHSGPDGNVVAGHYLFAGDYPSTVRVFDLSASLSSPPEVAEI